MYLYTGVCSAAGDGEIGELMLALAELFSSVSVEYTEFHSYSKPEGALAQKVQNEGNQENPNMDKGPVPNGTLHVHLRSYELSMAAVCACPLSPRDRRVSHSSF